MHVQIKRRRAPRIHSSEAFFVSFQYAPRRPLILSLETSRVARSVSSPRFFLTATPRFYPPIDSSVALVSLPRFFLFPPPVSAPFISPFDSPSRSPVFHPRFSSRAPPGGHNVRRLMFIVRETWNLGCGASGRWEFLGFRESMPRVAARD